MITCECRFCFVPAVAAPCSGQAAFKYSRSQQIKPVWETQGETKLERSPGVATCPCPALPKATAPQQKPEEPARVGRAAVAGVSRSRAGLSPGPPAKLGSCLPERRAMGGEEMLRKQARSASCSLPACLPLTPPAGTPPWGWGAEADCSRDSPGVKLLARPSAWGAKRGPATHRGSLGKWRGHQSPQLTLSATHLLNTPCQICAWKIWLCMDKQRFSHSVADMISVHCNIDVLITHSSFHEGT